MEKIIDYRPARCTGTMPEEFKDYHVCQPKIDGARYTLNIGFDPTGRKSGTTLLSRQLSTHDGLPVDKTENIPHITANKKLAPFAGTVIDLEIFKNNFGDTISIMGSLPPVAINKQNIEGNIHAFAFDVMAYKGKDVRGMALSDRLKILNAIVEAINIPELETVPTWPASVADIKFKEIVGDGGEGLIIKDLRMGYGCNWSKWKKRATVSAIISGFDQGQGKYSKTLGALKLSVYHEGKLIEIATASGMSDKERAEIWKNQAKLLGKVVDVHAMEISKDNRLRHPAFDRFRPDVSAKDCTLLKVRTDLKKSFKRKVE